MLEKLEEKFMDERLEIEKDACLDGVCEQQLAVVGHGIIASIAV